MPGLFSVAFGDPDERTDLLPSGSRVPREANGFKLTITRCH